MRILIRVIVIGGVLLLASYLYWWVLAGTVALVVATLIVRRTLKSQASYKWGALFLTGMFAIVWILASLYFAGLVGMAACGGDLLSDCGEPGTFAPVFAGILTLLLIAGAIVMLTVVWTIVRKRCPECAGTGRAITISGRCYTCGGSGKVSRF